MTVLKRGRDPSPRPLHPGGCTDSASSDPSPWQVATEAEGRQWSLESSPAQNWTPPQPRTLPSAAHR